MNKKQKKTLARIVLAAVLVVTLGLLPIRGSLRLALYLLTYLVIGSDIFVEKAGRGILNRQVFDENFLMAVATVGAFSLAIYTAAGTIPSHRRSCCSIRSASCSKAMPWQEPEEHQRSDGQSARTMPISSGTAALEQVDPEEVAVGSVIVVQPGEKIPLDGQVIEGSSTLNTSA